MLETWRFRRHSKKATRRHREARRELTMENLALLQCALRHAMEAHKLKGVAHVEDDEREFVRKTILACQQDYRKILEAHIPAREYAWLTQIIGWWHAEMRWETAHKSVEDTILIFNCAASELQEDKRRLLVLKYGDRRRNQEPQPLQVVMLNFANGQDLATAQHSHGEILAAIEKWLPHLVDATAPVK